MRLWLSMRFMGEGPVNHEFNGVFDSEELAVKACTTPDDYIAEVTLNERAPEESCPFPFSYYPVPCTDEETAARISRDARLNLVRPPAPPKV